MTWFRNRRAATTALAVLGLAGLLAATSPCAAEVLPRAPREVLNHLRVARAAAAAGRYSDAVQVLEAILTGPHDGFVPAAGPLQTQRTVKVEATALLGSLPPTGLEAHEIWCGGKARGLLDEAVEHRDRAAFARVAQQYPCTVAGAEAILILGFDGLDRGRPLEALAWFERLARAPAVASRFEPELTLAIAAARLTAGQAEQARQALDRLGSLGPGVRFRVGNAEFAADGDPERVMAVLAAELSTDAFAPSEPVAGWTMFRGDRARARVADWSGAIGPLAWKVDVPGPKSSGSRRFTRASASVLLSAAHPLVVGSTVLARTPRRLMAIDPGSGRRIWEFPWGGDPDLDETRTPKAHVTILQRTHDDAPYGQLASDGRLVFVLDGLSQARNTSHPVAIVVGGRRVITRGQPKPHNRLAALALKKEGKLAWSVGGESGEDEPKLAGAFFLGPPLVDGGRLYVLAEHQGQINLCTLDASTGGLAWSLPLAVIERPILNDPVRRLAGATPSMADGVLVCPTSAGAVVAVDPVARSILWGHQYPTAQQSSRSRQLLMMGFGLRGANQQRVGSVDATATIVDGRVLLAPVESEELLCLDLGSGELAWKRPLEDLLYVGGVSGGTVLAVGSKSLSAWQLRSGKPAWGQWQVDLPDGAKTSGHGFPSGRHYYLPTDKSEILKIEIATGRVVKRLPTKCTPGNLVALGPLLVSQSTKAVEAFVNSP